MSILNDAVRSSTSTRGYGLFEFDRLESEEIQLIKSIGRNQRRRWGVREQKNNKRNNRIIPCQVLKLLWLWGIKIVEDPPERGMRLQTFVDLLYEFASFCEHVPTKLAASHLYRDTVRFELMPDWRSKLRPPKSPH